MLDMNWLFRDPLRPLSFDKFPYQRGEDEIEIDFMMKAPFYLGVIFMSNLFFMEGGFLVLGLLWVLPNWMRRKS